MSDKPGKVDERADAETVEMPAPSAGEAAANNNNDDDLETGVQATDEQAANEPDPLDQDASTAETVVYHPQSRPPATTTESGDAPEGVAPGPPPAGGVAGAIAASGEEPPEPFTGEPAAVDSTGEDSAGDQEALNQELLKSEGLSNESGVEDGFPEQGDLDQGDPEDGELDGEPEPEPVAAPAGPIELAEEEDEEIHKDWYILKVQSNRERSIAAALERKVAIEGLGNLFGQILVPTEKVTEFKAGKKKVVERKLWPGYIAVEMHVNDDTWFAIRETGGIGDFTGSGGAPTPMAPHEVAKILHKEEEETDEAPKLDIKFAIGDKVKVKDGNFESFEGEVATIDDASGKVSVMISIFGRSTPVELEYWQVETL